MKAEIASETLVRLHKTARVHKPWIRDIDIHRCGNLKVLCFFLPWFSFSVNPTPSVYTQHGPKEKSTRCYCRLRRFSDIQQTDRQTDRQSHAKVTYCVCICDTALLQLDSIISVTSSSNTYSYVPRWNISPHIFVIPASKAIYGTYE